MPTIVVTVQDTKQKSDTLEEQLDRRFAQLEKRLTPAPAPVAETRKTDQLLSKLVTAQDRMLEALQGIKREVAQPQDFSALEAALNKNWQSIQQALTGMKSPTASVELPTDFYDRLDAIEAAMTKTPKVRMPLQLQASMDAILDALRIANRRPVGMNR